MPRCERCGVCLPRFKNIRKNHERLCRLGQDYNPMGLSKKLRRGF